MQLLEKHPSEGPREVCRAVILIVRRSALVKVDSPRAIDQCIDFFGESKERHAPCVTPLGKGRPGGALAGVHPAALVAHPLAALVERTSIDPQVIDDVIAGCVSQIGEQSTKIARRAVLAAGRRDHAVVHRRSLHPDPRDPGRERFFRPRPGSTRPDCGHSGCVRAPCMRGAARNAEEIRGGA